MSAFLLSLVKFLIALFIPRTKDTAHVATHPANPDYSRYADPERLRPFGQRATRRLGTLGHPRENHTRGARTDSDPPD